MITAHLSIFKYKIYAVIYLFRSNYIVAIHQSIIAKTIAIIISHTLHKYLKKADCKLVEYSYSFTLRESSYSNRYFACILKNVYISINEQRPYVDPHLKLDEKEAHCLVNAEILRYQCGSSVDKITPNLNPYRLQRSNSLLIPLRQARLLQPVGILLPRLDEKLRRKCLKHHADRETDQDYVRIGQKSLRGEVLRQLDEHEGTKDLHNGGNNEYRRDHAG